MPSLINFNDYKKQYLGQIGKGGGAETRKGRKEGSCKKKQMARKAKRQTKKECRVKSTENCLQSATEAEASVKNRATRMVGAVAFVVWCLTRLS